MARERFLHLKAGQIRSYLKSKNYHYRVSAKKGRLVDLAARAALGLCSYDNCTTTALKGYIRARGLALPKGRKTVHALMRVLEEADKVRFFRKLHDLPTEMREAIYGHHIAFRRQAIRSMPECFLAPPQTFDNDRRLRGEFLYHFYKDFRPNMLVCPPGSNADTYSAAWHRQSLKIFTHDQADDLLHYVGKLSMDFFVMERQVQQFTQDEAYHVEVDFKAEGRVVMRWSQKAGATFQEGWQEKKGILEERVKGKLEEMGARGAAVLQKMDSYDFADILREVGEMEMPKEAEEAD